MLSTARGGEERPELSQRRRERKMTGVVPAAERREMRGAGPAEVTPAGAGLPDGIAAAWGVRERPHKGPKPALSLPRIVDAAVRVADADGLDAVSMGRVAAELGTAPMSLYRHVSAKEELLGLMVDAAWDEAPGTPVAGEGW